MKRQIDVDAYLTPISEDRPSGEDLRYTAVYEQIKEARRFDDPLDQGEWKTELKTADWDKVISLAGGALKGQTKDLQIAAWLLEALVITEGFRGLTTGLNLMTGLLDRFWETLYPLIEEGDLEYRVAPLEFLNEKISTTIRQAPVTDSAKTPGYSWLKWQESREVGYEADTRDKYGDTDEGKKRRREDLIQERRLTAEEFDGAVNASPPAFYTALSGTLTDCLAAFTKLDNIVDEKFGKDAPRLAEFGKSIEDCLQVVQKICKEKGFLVSPAAEPDETTPGMEAPSSSHDDEASSGNDLMSGPLLSGPTEEQVPSSASIQGGEAAPATAVSPAASQASSAKPSPLSDMDPWEQFLWEQAIRTISGKGLKKALETLLGASLDAPSVRERNRLKLLVARLCLKAGRTDLARPILEQLASLVEQLQLEQWESPVWIAEVLGGLYQCLMSGEPSDDDYNRAVTIFQRLCTIDITKALGYKKE